MLTERNFYEVIGGSGSSFMCKYNNYQSSYDWCMKRCCSSFLPSLIDVVNGLEVYRFVCRYHWWHFIKWFMYTIGNSNHKWQEALSATIPLRFCILKIWQSVKRKNVSMRCESVVELSWVKSQSSTISEESHDIASVWSGRRTSEFWSGELESLE